MHNPATKQYEHHGKVVHVISEVKGKHREHCLCWSCQHFTPENRTTNCPMANALFDLCVEFNLVTPVYECPTYGAKNA